MNSPLFSTPRTCWNRLLTLVIIIGMLCPVLAAPPAVSAQSARPGAADPAANFYEWRDDEIFVTTPLLSDFNATFSRIFEAGSDLMTIQLKEEVKHALPADQHDATAAAAGHFLSPDNESIAEAYRNGSNVEVRLFKEPDAGATLPNLAARVEYITDFFDIAAGDLDGFPRSATYERRDEVVVVYALPAVAGSPNLLPLQVAVLDFARASLDSPGAPVVTTATAPDMKLAVASASYPIASLDNELAVATGDFDGNGLDEIAVAYLAGPQTLKLEVFRYSGTRQPSGAVVFSLAHVGGGSVQLTGKTFIATLSLAAGDFNGDDRDELAVGTADYVAATGGLDVNVRMFQFTGVTDLTVSQVREVLLRSGSELGATGRVQIAAGLFKFAPAQGWSLSRRQLAVAYEDGTSGGVRLLVRTIEFANDLTATVNAAWSLAANPAPFWLTAGGFKGRINPNDQDPSWSLALLKWEASKLWTLSFYQTAAGAAPVRKLFMQEPTSKAPTPGARLALVATDHDGDTVYLGAPVHFTVENLVSTDFILQEPPKHAYWDPIAKEVKNVSRYDDFAITLERQTGTQLSSTNTDTADYAIGGSVTASAGATIGGNYNIGIAKASAEVTTEVTATVGYDYDRHASTYNTGLARRTVGFTGKTDRDDFIVGRIQTLDIWRYRIYGLPPDPGQPITPTYPFMDIVLPGPWNSLATRSGGLNFDWYQPTHENGNVLSYPVYNSATTANPPDLGSCTISDGTPTGQIEVTGLMYPPTMLFYDGTSGSESLEFSTESGGGTARSYSHKLTANASVRQSATAKAEAFGASVGASASLEVELHGNASWGNAKTSDNVTSESTGITLNRVAGFSDKAYAIFPLIYTTDDGTIKATYAVNLLGSAFGRDWWAENYGQQPDLALNLPKRIVPGQGDGVWIPNTGVNRKEIRGFFVRSNAPDPVTGERLDISGAVKDGAVVRLETRVYNYSVGMDVPVRGGQACFSKVAFDPVTRQESGSRTPIGCTNLPDLSSQQMITASVPWDTTDQSGVASQTYRIYVNLVAPAGITEKYPAETPGTQTYCDPLKPLVCIDPGQNNEGYGYVTVAKTGFAAGMDRPAHVGMAEDGIAAVDLQGQIATGRVVAYLNRPLQVRVTVTTDTPSLDIGQVLVYDGDPDQGGELIAGKAVNLINSGPEGNSVWFDWIPTRLGAHQLFAEVLQSVNDSAPGNNTATLEVVVVTPFVYLPLMIR